MNDTNYSDEEILEMYKDVSNRDAAFRIIVNKYGAQLYGRIRTIVGTHDAADDVLQNTFIKAWRSLDNFRLDASLYTWLFRIATNEALTYMRKIQNKTAISIDDEEIQVSLPGEQMDSSETSDEIAEKLQSAVDSLPQKQRQVFCMKYYKEMKYNDMAEILKTSVGALKASYHHAVKKIENFLSFN